ncbi:alpha carbonic anhydrase 1, chloroplastic isoform X1 [Cinnamomum micranthum f. kanehirae]|uniref:Carbonic anhydrase n=1 Tax=Cinnamomum micranthum f. kanehirae TaxID=337451 RepID=A0A3S4NZ58_9MAGN|nr:alpha carbonic anhydrase 1, chloroplastic isoform X1 [Cinnamomum micranthum f. kanehirae]
MVVMAAGVIVFLVAPLLIAFSEARFVDLKFGYIGSKGPGMWGNLNPDFHACSSGKIQSPINIVTNDSIWDPNLEPLIRDYNPANATLVDNGFNIAVQWQKNGGVVTIEGKEYRLQQLHWHSPSEHMINGVRFPAELHLVHRSDDGNISVVAIMYKFGDPDPFLIQIKDYISQLTKEVFGGDENPQVPLGNVRTKQMKKHTHKYYRYIGSLTVPPCTERVIWNILGKVREFSKEQLLSLRAPLDGAYRNNARPLQPLNGRHVYLYDEDHTQ